MGLIYAENIGDGKFKGLPCGKDTDCYAVMEMDLYHKYQSLMRELREKNEYLKEELNNARELNRNLKRIAAERAGRKSGAVRSCTGYFITGWTRYVYKCLSNTIKTASERSCELYRINVQTPIDCSINMNLTDHEIIDAIDNDSLHLCDPLKLRYYIENARTEDVITEVFEQYADMNFILERQYYCDVNAGLWNVSFITNFEPEIVPKNRKNYV